MEEEERTHGWIWLAAAAVIAGAAVFVMSPWWSIASFARALQAEDKQRIAMYVDFPRVRESIAAQVNSQMTESMGEEVDKNPYAGLGALLGTAIIDRMVDTFVTPDGFARLMKKSLEENGAINDRDVSRVFIMRRAYDRMGLEWLSHREIRATIHDDTSKPASTVVLERQGLRWRIVDIEVPDLGM